MEHISNEERAREYLLKEHLSPLNNVLHQCDLKIELQYHRDIENAFIKGAEWKCLMAESKSIGVDILQNKEKQIIARAKTFLKEIARVCDITDEHGYRVDERYLLAELERAMKGE